MRIAEAARQLGVSTITVRQYCDNGELTFTCTPKGQRIFSQDDIDKFLGRDRKDGPGKTAHYIRVSDGNATALENQRIELENAYGAPDKLYKDKASGLSENRKGLQRLIRDAENGKIRHVKITYPDRLTRFGYSYIEHILNQAGVDIECLHERKEEPHEELMQDFMSLIASFSGRFYKMRSIENQRKLVSEADEKLATKAGTAR